VRILLLTPQLPYPPHQGTAMRNYGLLQGLAHRHQVHLLSFRSSSGSLSNAEPLYEVLESFDTAPQPTRSSLERVRGLLTSHLPDMAHRLASPDLRAALARVLVTYPFDIVQFEGIEMVPYLDTLLQRPARTRPLLVFDDHNAEYVLQQRVFEADARLPRRWPWAAYSLVQWQRLRRYESWACRQVDVVLAVSEPDRRALARIVPEAQIDVVPNGIDLEAYSSYQAPDAFLPPHSLVFTGKMDFRPNVDAVLWFADHVLPLIQAVMPDVHFYVVGQRPHQRLDPLQGRTGITVTGWVPETRPYIAGADVYVIPLRSGGGTRLKVLEAAAMRRPIVSTTMGCDGFPVTSGCEVLLADEPQAFAEHVLGLLTQPQRGASLARNAFQFAAGYDWGRILPRVEAAYARGQQRRFTESRSG
jgi:glycosyltransferase involved in cell wall biosynthesis